MARAAGLSRAHFSREFSRAFGVSPHAYLLTRRLERAAALLRTTDRSVAEICSAVGLSSVGSFTTSFTRTFGISDGLSGVLPAGCRRRASRPACARSTGARNTARFEKTGRRPGLAWGASQTPLPRRTPMIRIATAQLWVHDQDAALAFYTEKLGMEVRADATLPEMGDFRWLTVGPAGQPDIEIVLMKIPGEPVIDADTADQVRALMAKGLAGTIFLETDDCRADYEDLMVRGVEFVEKPPRRPTASTPFRDPSGNHIRLTQVQLAQV